MVVPTYTWEPAFETFDDRVILYNNIERYLQENRRVSVKLDMFDDSFPVISYCSCCNKDLLLKVYQIITHMDIFIHFITVEVTPSPPEGF